MTEVARVVRRRLLRYSQTGIASSLLRPTARLPTFSSPSTYSFFQPSPPRRYISFWSFLEAFRSSPPINKMEVTVENFKEALPQIIEDIKQADFISLDTEFSGIFKGGKEQKGANRHYTVEQRYEIYRKDAEKFQVLQLGICTVKFNRDIGMPTYPLGPALVVVMVR